jgi:hypothetical protein
MVKGSRGRVLTSSLLLLERRVVMTHHLVRVTILAVTPHHQCLLVIAWAVGLSVVRLDDGLLRVR